MQRRVVDTACRADGPRWEGLATRALLLPPPYHPVPGAPVYHLSLDDRTRCQTTPGRQDCAPRNGNIMVLTHRPVRATYSPVMRRNDITGRTFESRPDRRLRARERRPALITDCDSVPGPVPRGTPNTCCWLPECWNRRQRADQPFRCATRAVHHGL